MNSRDGEWWSEEGIAWLEFVHGGSSHEREREREREREGEQWPVRERERERVRDSYEL